MSEFEEQTPWHSGEGQLSKNGAWACQGGNKGEHDFEFSRVRLTLQVV